MNHRIKILIAVMLVILATSCKKYLEKKPSQGLATPETMADLEALLNFDLANKGSVLANGSTDEFYFTYTDWLSRSEVHKNGYIWDPALNDFTDWRDLYLSAFYANTVLFNLDLIPDNGDAQRWKKIKGAALFYRALAFFRITQLYAPQYESGTANITPGIVLRKDADFNIASTRSTLQETYDYIINDLQEAKALLPGDLPTTTINKTTPTIAAVHGLLARVYLQMNQFAKAKEQADLCLQLHSTLLDYTDPAKVNPAAATPFKLLNEEVIFYSNGDGSPASGSRAKADTNLYNLYAATDVRKTAFFLRNADNSLRFKGSYNEGSVNLFCGIATDELYLIRAECYARESNTNAAMQDLNALLAKRIKPFVPLVAGSADEALTFILAERRKELPFRELRWSDLKRLNKEPARATTLTRNLNGQLYTLAPNDLRYTLLIPDEVIRITTLQQNPR
jgi:hypothetical protein